MNSTNLPILYQNCLLQFSTEIARKAWLWFAETRDHTPMKYPSDTYACEVDLLVLQLTPLMEAGFRGHNCADPEVLTSLMQFTLKRHANWRVGENVRMWWEGGAA